MIYAEGDPHFSSSHHLLRASVESLSYSNFQVFPPSMQPRKQSAVPRIGCFEKLLTSIQEAQSKLLIGIP